MIPDAVGILISEKTGKFHPILFRISPPPSGGPDGTHRLKSIGHHTEGFMTKEEAIADIDTNEKIKDVHRMEEDLLWQKEESPAVVCYVDHDFNILF